MWCIHPSSWKTVSTALYNSYSQHSHWKMHSSREDQGHNLYEYILGPPVEVDEDA